MKSRRLSISIATVIALLYSGLNQPGFADSGSELNTWKSLYELAIQRNFDGKEAEAESYFEKALNEIRRRKEGSNEELMTLCRLADICLKRRNSVKAENYFAKVKKLALDKKADKTLDKESAAELDALSISFNDYNPRNEEKKLRFLLNSLFLKDFVSGDEHPNIRNTLVSLVTFYVRKREFPKAEPLATRLVKIDQKSDFESNDVLMELFTLGNIKRSLKKYAEAESFYRQSLAIANTKEKLDPSLIPRIKCALAENLILTKDLKLARQEASDALDRLVRDYGASTKDTVLARNILSKVDVKLGNTIKAVEQKEICVDLVNKYYGRNNPMNIENLRYLYKYYRKKGNSKKVKRLGPEIKYIESLMSKKK